MPKADTKITELKFLVKQADRYGVSGTEFLRKSNLKTLFSKPVPK